MEPARARRRLWNGRSRKPEIPRDQALVAFQVQRRSMITLRFSPRFGLAPVSRALTNSNTATAVLAGPSQSSAVSGVIRSTHTFGSSGPFHHRLSVYFQISAALAWSRQYRGARGDREDRRWRRCRECHADLVLGVDLLFFAAAQIRRRTRSGLPCGRAALQRAARASHRPNRVVSMQTPTFSMMSQTR